MFKNFILSLIVLMAIITGCQTESDQTSSALSPYPVTQKVDTVDIYFGTEVADPYRWLEDDRSEATGQWVAAQNEVTFGYLNNIPFRQKLKERLTELIDYERIYAPTKHGDFNYYYRNDGLQNQNVLYRKRPEDDGKGEVFIDPNQFKADGTISLASTSFTKDGSMMAMLISEGGSDWRKAVVLNTLDKTVVGDTLVNIKFSGLSWWGNDGFFYSSYEKPEEGSELSGKTQFHRLLYHKIGTPQSEDKLIFGGQQEPRRYIFGGVTDDQQYLYISAAESTSGNQLYVKKLGEEDHAIIPLVEDFDNEYGILTNQGDVFYVQTDFQAPNGRIVAIDLTNREKSAWKDKIPETENSQTDT